MLFNKHCDDDDDDDDVVYAYYIAGRVSFYTCLLCVSDYHPPLPRRLTESLGARLELQHTEAMWTSALLCYVCAGSVDRLVQCWERTRPDAVSPHALQVRYTDTGVGADTRGRYSPILGTMSSSSGFSRSLSRPPRII